MGVSEKHYLTPLFEPQSVALIGATSGAHARLAPCQRTLLIEFLAAPSLVCMSGACALDLSRMPTA
jgi:hypothetical protein